MSEQFTNLAETTVAAGGYTAGSGVINVASTGSPFPAAATFRVTVWNSSDGSVKVILTVTAVNSGTQWAVTAEGADANANAGDPVTLTITAGAMRQMRADAVQTGADADKIVEMAGNLYLPNNGAYLRRDTGSGWGNWGPIHPFTEPVLGDFSWENQGSPACWTWRTSKAILTASGTPFRFGYWKLAKTCERFSFFWATPASRPRRGTTRRS